MCYDYVHLDNLSDISAYRNHNVQQCKMQIPLKDTYGLNRVYYMHYVNRYMSMIV